MGITQTLLIYGLVGAAVAATMLLQDRDSGPWRRALRFAAGLLFWPAFVPALLAARADRGGGGEDEELADARLAAARARLLAVVNTMDGSLGGLLAPEVKRIERLTRALAILGRRVGEMDRLLEVPSIRQGRTGERLRAMRDQAEERYLEALARMEEMSAAVMLLQLAEGSGEEAVESLRDLAARVEGLTEGMLAT